MNQLNRSLNMKVMIILVKHYVTEKTNSPRAALTEPLMRAQMDSHGSLSIKLEKLVVSTLFSILILVLTVKLKDMICLGFFFKDFITQNNRLYAYLFISIYLYI